MGQDSVGQLAHLPRYDFDPFLRYAEHCLQSGQEITIGVPRNTSVNIIKNYESNNDPDSDTVDTCN